MENAIKQAELYEKGELSFDDKQQRTQIKPLSKKGSFQCPFCGNDASDPMDYHSSLTIILTIRFTDFLKDNKGENYSDGVMDCIHAVFGGNNSVMKEQLGLAGYLDAFKQRYGKYEEDLEYKLRCAYCGELKWDRQITIDDSKVARLICEDCLSNEIKGGSKNERKKASTNSNSHLS